MEDGIFNDNWRIRQSSVELLGDLLFKVDILLHILLLLALATVYLSHLASMLLGGWDFRESFA